MPLPWKKPSRVDLSETNDFFLALKQQRIWRERMVAELRFGHRNHIRSVNTYQVNFPPQLLESFRVHHARTANVLLPLTVRDKRPLLNLKVSGPGGTPATVPARRSIAALQTLYLVALAEESNARTALLPAVDARLLEAICGFSPSFFERTYFAKEDEELLPALVGYFNNGLPCSVTQEDILRWREVTGGVGRFLAAQLLPEAPERFSSSEEMLLAVPDMSPQPTSVSEIDEVVATYAEAVQIAARAEEREWLKALAEYGRRYELIVEAELPLRESGRVRVEEDLPLKLNRRKARYWVRHPFALGEAGSAHLEARLDDPNVEISERRKGLPDHGIRVRDLEERDASGWLEAVRVTRETLAIYGSDPDRPGRVYLEFRLRMARHVMATTALLTLLNLLAIVFSVLMEPSDDLASRLAVVAVPTTVAAAFALIREQTTLAARLQTIPRAVLALSAATLWIIVSLQLIVSGPADEGSEARTRPPDAPQLWHR